MNSEGCHPVSRHKVLSVLKKSLSALNAPGGRYLTVDNLHQVLQPFGLSEDPGTVDLVREAHLTADGRISFEKFDKILQKQLECLDEPVDECVRNAFNLLDYDQNGYITIPELFHVFGEVGEMWTDNDLLEVVEAGDIDGDGRLDLEDFFKFLGYNVNVDQEETEATSLDVSQSLWPPAIEKAQLSLDAESDRPVSAALSQGGRRKDSASIITIIREAEDAGLLRYSRKPTHTPPRIERRKTEDEIPALLALDPHGGFPRRFRSHSLTLLKQATIPQRRKSSPEVPAHCQPRHIDGTNTRRGRPSLEPNSLSSLLSVQGLQGAIKQISQRKKQSTRSQPCSRRQSLAINNRQPSFDTSASNNCDSEQDTKPSQKLNDEESDVTKVTCVDSVEVPGEIVLLSDILRSANPPGLTADAEMELSDQTRPEVTNPENEPFVPNVHLPLPSCRTESKPQGPYEDNLKHTSTKIDEYGVLDLDNRASVDPDSHLPKNDDVLFTNRNVSVSHEDGPRYNMTNKEIIAPMTSSTGMNHFPRGQGNGHGINTGTEEREHKTRNTAPFTEQSDEYSSVKNEILPLTKFVEKNQPFMDRDSLGHGVVNESCGEFQKAEDRISCAETSDNRWANKSVDNSTESEQTDTTVTRNDEPARNTPENRKETVWIEGQLRPLSYHNSSTQYYSNNVDTNTKETMSPKQASLSVRGEKVEPIQIRECERTPKSKDSSPPVRALNICEEGMNSKQGNRNGSVKSFTFDDELDGQAINSYKSDTLACIGRAGMSYAKMDTNTLDTNNEIEEAIDKRTKCESGISSVISKRDDSPPMFDPPAWAVRAYIDTGDDSSGYIPDSSGSSTISEEGQLTSSNVFNEHQVCPETEPVSVEQLTTDVQLSAYMQPCPTEAYAFKEQSPLFGAESARQRRTENPQDESGFQSKIGSTQLNREKPFLPLGKTGVSEPSMNCMPNCEVVNKSLFSSESCSAEVASCWPETTPEIGHEVGGEDKPRIIDNPDFLKPESLPSQTSLNFEHEASNPINIMDFAKTIEGTLMKTNQDTNEKSIELAHKCSVGEFRKTLSKDKLWPESLFGNELIMKDKPSVLQSTPDSGFAEQNFGALLKTLENKVTEHMQDYGHTKKRVLKCRKPVPLVSPRYEKKLPAKRSQPRQLGLLPYRSSPVTVKVATHPNNLYRQGQQGKCIGMGLIFAGQKFLPENKTTKQPTKCPSISQNKTSLVQTAPKSSLPAKANPVGVFKQHLALTLRHSNSRDNMLRHQSLSRSMAARESQKPPSNKTDRTTRRPFRTIQQSVIRLQLPENTHSKIVPKKLSLLSSLPNRFDKHPCR